MGPARGQSLRRRAGSRGIMEAPLSSWDSVVGWTRWFSRRRGFGLARKANCCPPRTGTACWNNRDPDEGE